MFKAIIYETNIPFMFTINDYTIKPGVGEYQLNISADSIITIIGFGGTFKLTPDLAFRSEHGPGACYIVKTINHDQPKFSDKKITFCIIGGGNQVYRVYILKSESPLLQTGNMPTVVVSIGADSAVNYSLAGYIVTVPLFHRFQDHEYNDDNTLKGGGKKHKKNKSKKRRKNKSKKRKRKTRRKRR